ncbi:MAG: ATP-binding protein [Chloroflexota bacterium]
MDVRDASPQQSADYTSTEFPRLAVMRWLTFSIVTIIIGVSALLSYTVFYRTETYITNHSEENSIYMAHHLNQVLYPDFLPVIQRTSDDMPSDTTPLNLAVERVLIGLNIHRLAILDIDGRVVYETTTPSVYPEDIQAATRENINQALIGTESSQLIQQTRDDGATESIFATYVPIRSLNDGQMESEVIGSFVLEQDVSDTFAQIRYEQTITTLAILALMSILLLVLLVLVRRATRIIRNQHDELSERNRALVKLQRARQDLVSLLVHDLRSPLTAISGYLDLLGASSINSQQQGFVTVARDSSRSMQRLISTILDMQQLQDGHLPLERQPTEVAELLRESAYEFYGWAQRDEKEIHIDVKPDLPLVCADVDILRRIVANLLGNALKHTPPETHITLAATVDADQVLLTVADNGPGIPSKLLPHLFTRYVRGRNTEKREVGSSGLGLSFCRLAVEAHGGRIDVVSSPEQGTTFKIWLPALQISESTTDRSPEDNDGVTYPPLVGSTHL